MSGSGSARAGSQDQGGGPGVREGQEPATYVEAPEKWDGSGRAVFLAGGITDCPDWQEAAANWFRTEPGWTVLNPRRGDFPIHDPSAAEEQIEWEFWHLHRADVVLFWFAEGPSPQPIALYELGRHVALGRRVAVGCNPGYLRRADVLYQLRLARPEIQVCDGLSETCHAATALVTQAEPLAGGAPKKERP